MPAEVWLDAPVKASGLMGRIGIRQIVYKLTEEPGSYLVEYVLPYYRDAIWRVTIPVEGDSVPPEMEAAALAVLAARAFGGNG